MEYWTLEHVKGHLVISRDHGRYLLDTGSPVSFLFDASNAETERLGIGKSCGTQAFPDIAIDSGRICESIGTHVDDDIGALIGMDVLSRFDMVVSIADSAIRLCRDELGPIGSASLAVEPLGGCPLVKGISINGSQRKVIWDTGAHVSYVADGRQIEALKVEEHVTDFHPFSTTPAFEVDLVKAPLKINGESGGVKLRTAVYPEGLPNLGFDILGAELATHYDVHLSMRQRLLSLRRRHDYKSPTSVRTSLGLPEVQAMLGKRVADVVWRKNGAGTPGHQFFIVFDDDTHHEIYSDDNFRVAGGVDSGGVEHVLEYAHRFESGTD